MKITFIGTSAAELYPGTWCSCDYCNYAREHGGRNIRSNSAIHFAGKCLIDLPPDLASKALAYNIDLRPTELLLCTHSHEDHFFPKTLHWRYSVYGLDALDEKERYKAPCARFGEIPQMRIFGNRQVFSQFATFLNGREMVDYALDYTIVEPYREYHHADVDFIPLIASHVDRAGERGLIYLVHAQGKSFLYATDSNTYIERTRDCIRGHKVDAVIMECTFGEADKDGGHMSFKRMWDEVRFFEESNIFVHAPQVYLTHHSPHRTPPYDQLCQLLKGTCVQSAYDGMELEL